MIKWIAWSFCAEEQQTFVDIVNADTSMEAASKVMRMRPYATMDLYEPPIELAGYIVYLQRELERPIRRAAKRVKGGDAAMKKQ